jgi:hypothetical protein
VCDFSVLALGVCAGTGIATILDEQGDDEDRL